MCYGALMADVQNIANTLDAEVDLSSEYVRSVSEALAAGDNESVRLQVRDLRPPDLADLIELLEPNQRAPFVTALGSEIDYDAFSELDAAVRDQLAAELPNAYLARAATELDSDDAAYFLETLEPRDRDEVLEQLPLSDRAALQRNLEYPEETAGRLMQGEFVSVAPFWNVGQVIDYMRETEELPTTFSEIYIVDPLFKVLGSVNLSHLLRSKRHVPIEEIMRDDISTVDANADQEDVARQFERYDLYSAPVVDASGRLVGVMTVDDVVEVIQEEADEDIRRLGGVGNESMTNNVLSTTQSRFIWLLVNLLTAVLASAVIKMFDASIEQMVALAVLMPIVASMGGNAGTQTMTVAVRALATRDLTAVNASRIVLREVSVGLLNGLLFALILALVTVLWFGSGALGLVIAAAMVFNHLAAALAGILVPLTLQRLGKDPAIASSVFVTTITDVVGFFAFLGLATFWLF
ncbi:MAG: magnesium transporter [Hyphomicrobiaceae bacterium TMED74]|nr:magnesium transporter [Filomicrobium sp.]RPG40598.1 MAG: magnesium transporter [Hyphomicrobiaceae bacterium TMED74]